MPASPRLLIHVQHLVGTGHLRRMLALGRACAADGFEVRLLSGGAPLPGVELADGLELVQLPPARAANGRFDRLETADGMPVDARWRETRKQSVLGEFDRFAPDVLLVETWPFGRRLVEFEILPLVERARQAGCRCASSIRDVLEPRTKRRRIDEMAARAAGLDAVLVHGDEALLPLAVSFGAGAVDVDVFAERLTYTGYVAEARAVAHTTRDDRVLVSAGGGAVGAALAATARAAATLDSSRTWRIYTGQNLPERDYARLREAAPANLQVARFTPALPAELARCAVSVSQAGYNTVVEAMQARCPCVLAPYVGEGEREQSIRATAFDRAGLAVALDADADAAALLQGVERATRAGPPAGDALPSIDGVRRTVAALHALVAKGPSASRRRDT